MRSLRYYVKSIQKIAKTDQHLIFNQRCRRYRVIPKCLRTPPPVRTAEGFRIAQRTAFQYLSARISELHKKKRHLENDCYFQKRQLQHELTPADFEAVTIHVDRIMDAEKQKSKQRQRNKFDRLLKQENKPSYQDRWIVNLSSVTISDQQKSVLSKGLNFAPTPNRIPVARIIANVETALKFLKASSTSVSNARSRIVGILNREPRLTPNLSPSERLALKQLKTNEDIIILPADKGRATVVLDRKDYDGKLLTMLSDTTVYKRLKRDPTSSLERWMNATLLELRRKDQLPERLYHRLRSSCGQTPRIYGLPKIHKPDIPLRPIVSFVTSPTY